MGVRPSASPDGSRVIYSSPKTNKGDIYSYVIKNKTSSKITHGPDYEGDPQYSRDGRNIVFVREQNSVGHIWIMNADGTNPRQLTDGPEYDAAPSISPDGSKIVFSRSVSDPRFRPGTGAASEIFTMNSDGSNQRRLTLNDRSDGVASFSPDGQKILYGYYDGSDGIAIMDMDGANSRRVGAGSSPAFSPDGQKIVFISGEYGREISIMNSDGSGSQTIHRSNHYHAYPTFTPDGSHILFVEEPEGRGTGTLMILDLETSKTDKITAID